MTTVTEARSSSSALATEWLVALIAAARSDGPQRGPARAALAEFRRCRDLDEVIYIPAFHELRAHVGATTQQALLSLARVAFVAAHVQEDRPQPAIAAQLAEMKGGQPTLHPLRFRRMLQADASTIHLHAARAVRALGGKVDLKGLFNAVYWWNESIKQRWAMDYFEIAPKEKNDEKR